MTWRKSIAVALVALSLTFGSVPTLARVATIATDAFTDANSTDLEAHTMTSGGLTWLHAGTCIFDVQSNKAAWNANTVACATTVDASDASVLVEVDIDLPNASDYAYGLVVRYSDASNYWIVDFVRESSGTPRMRIVRFESGSGTVEAEDTDIGAVSGTTQTLTATTNGNTITGYLGGVQTVQYTSATFNNTATRHGIFLYAAYDTSGRWDNFEIDSDPTFGGGGGPTINPAMFNSPIRGGGHVFIRR